MTLSGAKRKFSGDDKSDASSNIGSNYEGSSVLPLAAFQRQTKPLKNKMCVEEFELMNDAAEKHLQTHSPLQPYYKPGYVLLLGSE